MKSKNLIWLLVVALAPAAQAGVFTISSGTLNAVIPDNNVNGYQNSINVSSGSQPNDDLISSITVSLNISGGFNGDLYGYLVHTDPEHSQTTAMCVLLNRVGQDGTHPFGSAGSGFTVTLDDTASVNVHNQSVTAGSVLNGTFKPDGSTIDPKSGNTAPGVGTTQLAAFQNQSGDGTWTLFLSDVSAGGVGTLVSWSATITAVPEPVNCALGIFGAMGLGSVLLRRKK